MRPAPARPSRQCVHACTCLDTHAAYLSSSTTSSTMIWSTRSAKSNRPANMICAHAVAHACCWTKKTGMPSIKAVHGRMQPYRDSHFASTQRGCAPLPHQRADDVARHVLGKRPQADLHAVDRCKPARSIEHTYGPACADRSHEPCAYVLSMYGCTGVYLVPGLAARGWMCASRPAPEGPTWAGSVWMPRRRGARRARAGATWRVWPGY